MSNESKTGSTIPRVRVLLTNSYATADLKSQKMLNCGSFSLSAPRMPILRRKAALRAPFVKVNIAEVGWTV